MLKSRHPIVTALSGALLALAATASTAAPEIFFGEDLVPGASRLIPNALAAQASFLARITDPRVADFEGIGTGDYRGLEVTFGSGSTATLTGTRTAPATGIFVAPGQGRFATSGSQYLGLGSSDIANFTIAFSTPQSAFGFFATDVGDVGGRLTLSFDGGTPIVVENTFTPDGRTNLYDGSAFFWGIVDTATTFNAVRFGAILPSGELGADAFGFDDFTIALASQIIRDDPPPPPPPGDDNDPPTGDHNTVPEPGTLLLLATGVAGIGWQRRRRAPKAHKA